jgi:hypothetical protein
MIVFVATFAACIVPACSKGFLVERAELRGVNTERFEEEVVSAMGSMLGCGDPVDKDHLAAVQAAIAPMWRTLPKNAYDRVERRTLRYLVHRHFMKKSSLLLRGFEPSRPVNHSHWGAADILSQQVPAYVERQLESARALEHGFSIEDAAMMIVTLEQLIFDSESALIEKAYASLGKPIDAHLSFRDLSQVLETYLVHWMMGEDTEGINMLLENRTLLEATFPHWQGLVSFAGGQIKTLQFARQRPGLSKASKESKRALSTQFNFEDTHRVVGGITKSFASFWESECASMKSQLVDMDTLGTGRVKLSRFYGTALDSEWRFGESESYLRDLGALDETSRWIGKQVIIPNYMQAASNCIVSTPHYLVCCMNECESLLSEIEELIGTPSASPASILAVVSNITSQTTLDHDQPPLLKGALTTQLEEVGRQYKGLVPLHGRLFAQWLHYAFPRECPFPHKMGASSTATPTEFGESYLAQKHEMQFHANDASEETPLSERPGEWMSQWSAEEELMVDYAVNFHAPWEHQNHFVFYGMLVLLALGIYGGSVGFAGGSAAGKQVLDRDSTFWTTKSHLV